MKSKERFVRVAASKLKPASSSASIARGKLFDRHVTYI